MRLRFLGLALGGAALLAFPATGMADTIDVFPGHSIQHAVNHAHRGDTIKVHDGVYHQSVAWAVNYGLQADLDSTVAHAFYKQLPDADRASARHDA